MIKVIDIQQVYLDFWFISQVSYLTTSSRNTQKICPLMDKVSQDIWETILNAFTTPGIGYENYITWQVTTGHMYGLINASPTEEDIWN